MAEKSAAASTWLIEFVSGRFAAQAVDVAAKIVSIIQDTPGHLA